MEDKIWFLMFEIIAFAMVTVIIIFAVKGLVNNSSYWKKYYAADLALMADLESVNQGDFAMNYVLKPHNYNKYITMFALKDRKYDFVLKNDRVEVYDSPKEDSKYPSSYSFAPSRSITVQTTTITSADFLVLAKQKSVLSLDRYLITADSTCPSENTAKDINTLKFDVIGIDAQSKPFAASLKAVLSAYGRDSKTNELTIILSYEKDTPMTIYYADDMTKLRGRKLACIIGNMYSDQYPSNDFEIKSYDSSLDANAEFEAYKKSKNPDEYWIMMQLSEKEVAITPNLFPEFVRDALAKFYE